MMTEDDRGDELWTTLEPVTFASALELITKQLRFLKTRMPNVARLASSQQRRALEGEELSGSDDEGKDFDILLETAMADVVVEHSRTTRSGWRVTSSDAGKTRRRDAWRLAGAADPVSRSKTLGHNKAGGVSQAD